MLTNGSIQAKGHAFHPSPLPFRYPAGAPSPAAARSFSNLHRLRVRRLRAVRRPERRRPGLLRRRGPGGAVRRAAGQVPGPPQRRRQRQPERPRLRRGAGHALPRRVPRPQQQPRRRRRRQPGVARRRGRRVLRRRQRGVPEPEPHQPEAHPRVGGLRRRRRAGRRHHGPAGCAEAQEAAAASRRRPLRRGAGHGVRRVLVGDGRPPLAPFRARLELRAGRAGPGAQHVGASGLAAHGAQAPVQGTAGCPPGSVSSAGPRRGRRRLHLGAAAEQVRRGARGLGARVRAAPPVLVRGSVPRHRGVQRRAAARRRRVRKRVQGRPPQDRYGGRREEGVVAAARAVQAARDHEGVRRRGREPGTAEASQPRAAASSSSSTTTCPTAAWTRTSTTTGARAPPWAGLSGFTSSEGSRPGCCTSTRTGSESSSTETSRPATCSSTAR
ncbi:hypothetical protein PVAP13_2KG077800 [Panicum virgatum]|uniref:Uncharacterized protein n=1 Tax=Panicum virgatum TaxID=38727 RepID=A0A8T0WQD6_PANVG|nr:hypothetical protein PVAP13_2KG077800 [Panicum virgatum]